MTDKKLTMRQRQLLDILETPTAYCYQTKIGEWYLIGAGHWGKEWVSTIKALVARKYLDVNHQGRWLLTDSGRAALAAAREKDGKR